MFEAFFYLQREEWVFWLFGVDRRPGLVP